MQTEGTPTSSAASGPANSVVSLMTTSGDHARHAARIPGGGRARVDAREHVAHDALGDQPVGAPAADLGEDRVALLRGRVVEGPQRQLFGPDHLRGLARSGDEDVGAGAPEGAGEGDQRAEVTGPGLGRHENAHDRSDAGARVGFP
jgi:hypothetical protein